MPCFTPLTKGAKPMKILSLHIDGFGKFHNRDISFQDGLNVVYGKNEAGKSTLHTFIKGMLFGIERQRGRASKNDTYSKFQPWTRAVSMKAISVWNVTDRSTGSSAVSRKVTSAFVLLMKLPEKKRKITRLYGTSCAAACLKLLMIIPLALDS